jgi:hypothetical protein
MARRNPRYGSPEEALVVPDRSPNLKSCLEFHNADIAALVKHLNEVRCERCLSLFSALGQGTAHDEIFAGEQELSQVPTMERRYRASASNDRSIDRWLFNEYFLIPQPERPIVGSNDWFRWLDEFQRRHPAAVSGLTQPLAKRARQVLWNSR